MDFLVCRLWVIVYRRLVCLIEKATRTRNGWLRIVSLHNFIQLLLTCYLGVQASKWRASHERSYLLLRHNQRGRKMVFKEYKVLHIVEGGLGTIFLGASGIPIKKMEIALNKEATSGWTLAFQLVEQKRFLLFWKREAVIITLGR
jgi:hypothetical protein